MCNKSFRLSRIIVILCIQFISVPMTVNSAGNPLEPFPDIEAVPIKATGDMGVFAEKLFMKVHSKHKCEDTCGGKFGDDKAEFRIYEQSVDKALKETIENVNDRLKRLNERIKLLRNEIGDRVRIQNQFWKSISTKKYADAFGMAGIPADLKELAKTKALSKLEKYAWKSALTNEALSELYADQAREIVDSFPVGVVRTLLDQRLTETRNAIGLIRGMAEVCAAPNKLEEATGFINSFRTGGISKKLQREFNKVFSDRAPALALVRERARNCIDRLGLDQAIEFINSFPVGDIRAKLQTEFDIAFSNSAPSRIDDFRARIALGGALAAQDEANMLAYISLFPEARMAELRVLAALPRK